MRYMMNMFFEQFEQMQKSNAMLKQRALDEYELALKMPRKKKKVAKKSAILLYNIACWGEEQFSF
ncbi:MAG: hypothetical protein ACOH2V_00435 [Candidatus Saccharimonadaceae bacterium]